MESASDVAARFDNIAANYDRTRERLADDALAEVAAEFQRDGTSSILEAGVGTGRIALPLRQRGFDVTGLDLSPKMLAQARTKGMDRLVMAEAGHPPFRRKAFDAVTLAHVLQLLADPERTFQALREVAKKEMAVFLRKPDPRQDGANEARDEFYRAFGVAAREIGIHLGDRYDSWPERYAAQDDFLKRFPPDERITVQEMDYAESMKGYVSAMGPGCCRFTAYVSEADFARVVERMKLTMNLERVIPYHRVDQMLIWHL